MTAKWMFGLWESHALNLVSDMFCLLSFVNHLRNAIVVIRMM